MSSHPRQTSAEKAYSWYVVGVLMLCYALSFIDRQVLSLMVEPIKRDLVLTDTQFSLLQGLAFALFYTFVGLFMGRLADTKNRKKIIMAGLAAWSFMTACCGLAKGFFGLFAARVGVGVGEAALSPSAYSMIGDYFPKESLGRAMSTYTVGVYLGSGLAFLIGGGLIAAMPDMVQLPLLGELKSWQLTFIVLGLAGIPMFLLLLTVREPKRGRFSGQTENSTAANDTSIAGALSYFRQHKSFYLAHFIGMSMLTMVGYAYHSWVPAYFIRFWNWEVADIGVTYGLINILAAPAGVLTGGFLGDFFAKRQVSDAFVRSAIVGSYCLFVPAVLATSPMSPSPIFSLVALCFLHFFASFHGGMAIAALHTGTPIEIRAQATACYLFVINLIGLGLGPLLVALITDNIFQNDAQVGSSLMILGGIAVPMSIIILTKLSSVYSQRIRDGVPAYHVENH